LVLERYGDRLLVELLGSDADPIVCCQKSLLAETTVVVGDRVNLFLQQSSGNSSASNSNSTAPEFLGVVTSHLPRKTLLQRPLPSGASKSGTMKAIAANVDQVLAVVCAVPKVPLSSLDRVLVAAREYGMEAVLVLNKCDDVEGTRGLREELAHYPALGYQVLEVTVAEGLEGAAGGGGVVGGLEALRAVLRGKTSVLVGQSGVGKSSLVNGLLGGSDLDLAPGQGQGQGQGQGRTQQRTGALVRGVNIGAHTTSSARLFHLPGGPGAGALIDSPGIRELGVWHLPVEAIHAGFFEIAEHAAKCRFRNCQHTEGELGCAVLEGVRVGAVSPRRLQHWRDFTGQA